MRLFKKIVCPIDFSEYSDVAFQYAAALAMQNESQLIVCHSILDVTQAFVYLEGDYAGTVNDALVSNAAARLEAFVAKFDSKIKPSERIMRGDPAQAILDLATRENADLIVMGTHGIGGYDRFLMGSITNKVLHKATMPVLVVCNPTHHYLCKAGPTRVTIDRILCALDLESNNTKFIDLTIFIARMYGADIQFLHVMEEPYEQEQETMKRLKEIVDPATTIWCKAKCAIKKGRAANEILKTVDEEAIDLLVMGHHSRRPIDELFLGSVAKKLVSTSSCPVMVMRLSPDEMAPDNEDVFVSGRAVS
jgi:nucleotide-binding universal stress UspA family protein